VRKKERRQVKENPKMRRPSRRQRTSKHHPPNMMAVSRPNSDLQAADWTWSAEVRTSRFCRNSNS